MKILFVTPCIPSESDGRRPYNFIKHLSKTHEVHLLALRYAVQNERHIQAMKDMGVSVEIVPYQPVRSLANCFRALFQGVPFRAAWVDYPHVSRALRALLNQHSFDVVHFDRMRMGRYAQGLSTPCLIDFTDSLTLYLERARRFRRQWHEGWIDGWEAKTIPAFERELFSHCQVALVCSSVDAGNMKRYLGEIPLEVISNAVDANQFQPRWHEAPHRPRCVLTGTLFYFPNVDSVHFYARDLLPAIRRAFPTMESHIIGTRPKKEVLRYDGRDGVSILADVPKMEELMFADDIYICPLRVAAGIRNKLLEAMAAGMPVVTTRLGAEGLDLRHGQEVLFAETPDGYVAEITRLLNDAGLRETLRENGRRYVIEHHSLDHLGKQIEALYERIAMNA